MNLRKIFTAKTISLLVAVPLLLVLATPLFEGKAAAASTGEPKAPFKWLDNDHNQLTDANNNIYKPLDYFCAGNSVFSNKDATKIDKLSATDGLTDANRITETDPNSVKVRVGKCDSKNQVGNYAWITKTAKSYYAFTVTSPADKAYDTRYCPIKSGLCSAGVLRLKDGILQGSFLTTDKVGVVVAPGVSGAPSTATTPGATQLSDTNPVCETGGFGLNWILCPVFNTVAGFTDFLFRNLLEPLLRTAPVDTNPSGTTYQVWSTFRVYGNIFLVIALLIIVFGQAIGGGLVDAYTAKKVLPRLLAASILINLSIYIVAFAVDLTNILGGGIGRIITAPIEQAGAFSISPSLAQSGAIVGVPVAAVGIGAYLFSIGGLLSIGGAAIVGALPVIFLFLIMPVLFGLLIAFVTLLLRNAILLALVFVSPVAFALYCLPNTEKYFHKWWSLFTKALLVYPIVIVIFAVADVLSVTASSGNNSASPLASIISFVLQFLPLFLIPYAFKLAGGAIGQISGALSGYGKRAQEGIKGDARDPNSFRNRAKRRFGERFTKAEARLAEPGKKSTATARQQRSLRALNRLDRGWNSRQSQYTAEATKREDQISATGRDDQRYAASYFTVPAGQAAPDGVTDGGADVSGSVRSSLRYFDSKGRGISQAFALSSEAIHASSEHDAGRNLEYALRKAVPDEDLANYRRGFAATAIRQDLNQDEISGMHARASFEHKDKHPSEWYSSPKLVKGHSGGLDHITWGDIADPGNEKGQNAQVNELHRAKATFQLSSLRGRDVRSWSDRRNSIQDRMDSGVPINTQDAAFFAQTDELLDSLVTQQIYTQTGDDGPQLSSQGLSADAANSAKALVKNRRYRSTQAQAGTSADGSSTLVDVGKRIIYNEKLAESVALSTGLSKDRAADQVAVPIAQDPPRGTSLNGTVPISRIGKTVAVTGDAAGSIIPRSYTP